MGEPAGIGLELIAKLWKNRDQLPRHPFVVIGSFDELKKYTDNFPLEVLNKETLLSANALATDCLHVIDIRLQDAVVPGHLNPKNGQAVVQAIEIATSLALEHHVSAVVTAPIHKAALYNVGFDAPGHTEYLARLCGMKDDQSVMMLATQDLRVVPVTVHVPLKEVARNLTADKIIHAGVVTAHDLRTKFGIQKPHIAVAGLNPHAGESGTIGMEESTHIIPAVWALRDMGIDVTDPMPADTLFHAEARAKYDAVLCMYHDQALIPVKTVDFWGGVNITLGLPIIRTSPDHGTALELAGTGKARTDSMLAAINMAAEMVERQSTVQTGVA